MKAEEEEREAEVSELLLEVRRLQGLLRKGGKRRFQIVNSPGSHGGSVWARCSSSQGVLLLSRADIHFMAEETGVAIFMREVETGAAGGGARGRCGGMPLSCSVGSKCIEGSFKLCLLRSRMNSDK